MPGKYIIINGPNLNLLGKRETSIYGDQSFEDYFNVIKKKFPQAHIEYFQSNHEGDLIDKLHEVGFSYNGVVINPGGYTHTSIALADAIAGIETPVIEVHISNIYEREAFRHHSYVKPNCVKSIVGKGLSGYIEALDYWLRGGLTNKPS